MAKVVVFEGSETKTLRGGEEDILRHDGLLFVWSKLDVFVLEQLVDVDLAFADC